MPVPVNSTLVPRTTGYALVEDADVKGSFHTVDTIADRDAIPDNRRKEGMLVYVIDTTGSGGPSLLYQLGNNLLSWTEFSGGGGTAVGNIYYWTLAKTWAQVWAEVVAGGGNGIIYVDLPSTPSLSVTAAQGPYDFTHVEFRILPRFGPSTLNTIVFEAGTLIDAGAAVILRSRGQAAWRASTPLMTPDANKQVILDLQEGSSLGSTTDTTLFRSISTNQHSVYIRGGGLRTSSNVANPMFYLNAAGSVSIFHESLFSNSVGFTSYSGAFVGGILGSGATFYGTAETQQVWRAASVIAPCVTIAPSINPISLPRFANVSVFPGAPSAQNQGSIAWDLLTSTPRLSNGATWLELITSASGPVSRKADVSDILLTTGGATAIATYTPTTQGNYVLNVYYRVVVATTDFTLTVTWTDGSGAQTQTIINTAPQAVGSYLVAPIFINSTAAAITVTATAGTANQIYVSSSIVSV